MYWWLGWPWGYFIHRTTYTSDSDWNEGLAKLHRYIYCNIRHHEEDLEPVKIVWEGCRNVIIDDKELLEGASPTKVRQLFQDWTNRYPRYNHCGTPRAAFCLMIDDHALQSILASLEPSWETGNWFGEKVGYVILIHRHFPEKGYRHEPYTVGWMRLKVDGVWYFSRSFDVVEFEERYPGIRRPGLIPYFDGYVTWLEDVNGQKVMDVYSSGEEEDDEDEEEDGWDDETGYPVHDTYQYLKEGGHI